MSAEKLPGVRMWIHSATQDDGGAWMNIRRITFTDEELRALIERAVELAVEGDCCASDCGDTVNDTVYFAPKYSKSEIVAELLGDENGGK